MKLEILLATMNQPDDTFLDSMKVNSDIIVCNQNNERTGYKQYKKGSYNVRWYDFEEKGVGLNRNNALLRSTADICLLADDDVIFEDGYEKIILDAFEKNPDADVILFNRYSVDGSKRSESTKIQKVKLHNSGKYGAVRIAFRRLSVIKHSITFNQLFGGGCMFSAGEDSMFINRCLRCKLKAIAVPECILRLADRRPSTWFNGYNQKFFEDYGSLYCCHFGNFAIIVSLLQLIKKRKKWLQNYPLLKAWKHMRDGIKKYKNLR